MEKSDTKKSVEVQIWGHKYRVKSDMDENYIQKVASYVNNKMKEVSEGSKTLSTLSLAVLAAMNIAGDLYEANIEKENTLKDMEGRIANLNKMLDKVL